MSEKIMKEATELEYLKWFRCEADFGPADGDVKASMDEAFEEQTKTRVPKGWRQEEE